MKTKDLPEALRRLRQSFEESDAPIIELIEAQTKDPFKVLLGTILSARTKDEVTAKAVKKLFSFVTTPDDLERIPLPTLEKLIYPVGFYKTKARHLHRLPAVLRERFQGKLPSTIEELVQLPGVGRKTANLVVAVGFHKPAICVDTHVHRITNRWGYVTTTTPLETEMALRKKLPLPYWMTFNTYLVSFGQRICTPISPHCSTCSLTSFCKRKGVRSSR